MATSFVASFACVEVARNESFGDIASRFSRFFVIFVPANDKFGRPFGRSSVRYEFFNDVGRSVRILLEVLRCLCVVVFRWNVLGWWGVYHSVRVESFRDFVAIDYVRAFVFPYYAKRSECWLL